MTFLALSLALAAPTPHFAGVLWLEATIEEVGTVASRISVRDNGDSRVDTEGGGVGQQVSMLRWHDAPTRVVQLLHGEKEWVELPAQAVGAAEPEGPTELPKPIDVKRVGREKIAGIGTEHLQLREQPNGAVVDVWMTRDIVVDGAFFLVAPELANDRRFGDALTRRGFGGYPMKVVSSEAGHTVTVTTVKVEKKKLPTDLFEIPKGYNQAPPPKAERAGELTPP